MAKKNVVRKMEKNEVPTSAPLSDVERQELATASNAAPVEATKDGDGATRPKLTYPPLSLELYELLQTNSRGEAIFVSREGLKVHALRKGSPLNIEDLGQWFGVDRTAPADLTCFVDHKGGGEKPVAFSSVVMRDDGTLKTDERYVTAENPTGIVRRGNFLRMPGEDQKGLVPTFVCGAHIRIVQGQLARKLRQEKGHDVAVPAQSYEQSQMSIAGIRARNQEKRGSEQTTRDEVVAKLASRDNRGGRGGFRNGPQRATAGGQNRQRDPREHNIGNRTRVVSESQ